MLTTTDHDGLREARLDHPPANALRRELLAELRVLVDQAPTDGVEGLVISGTPGFFSAGLDVPHLLESDREEVLATFEELFDLLRAMCESEVPIAAALTGHATAGGAVLGVFSDYRVMADGEFKIGLNEVQVGLPMPAVIFSALERLVGTRMAERLCVEARLVSPGEAQRIGLVDALAPPEDVIPSAIAWCRHVLALPRAAMARTRMLARRRFLRDFEQTGSLVPPEFSEAWSSAETQAAMRALLERLKGPR